MVSLVPRLPGFFLFFSLRSVEERQKWEGLGTWGVGGWGNYRFMCNKSESEYLNSQAEHSQSHECLQSYTVPRDRALTDEI